MTQSEYNIFTKTLFTIGISPGTCINDRGIMDILKLHSIIIDKIILTCIFELSFLLNYLYIKNIKYNEYNFKKMPAVAKFYFKMVFQFQTEPIDYLQFPKSSLTCNTI